ncbi:MAG: hypothetical protein Q7T16_02750 [Candidatus Burarchaeum sp.]|nr:hypothetical protein [Candidatus Burarchaeum sp.]MDO8339553.1 hypothetical protein [Candidatus Burarchaeum sp.]
MFSTKTKTSKGQFFSLDVIAGSLIFMVAFFILAFYWLNAQAGMGDKTDDLQRESERIADQLMVPSQFENIEFTDMQTALGPMCPNYPDITDTSIKQPDDLLPVNYVSIINSKSRVLLTAMAYLNYTSALTAGAGSIRFYDSIKEKLGIPRYEYYITLEDSNGDVRTDCADFGFTTTTCSPSGPPPMLNCVGGAPPPPNAREIANAERIALFNRYRGEFDPDVAGQLYFGAPELVKVRVQVWRP